MRLLLACVAMLSAALLAQPLTTMAPLTTKRPWLPRRQSGFAFTSNIEQIAYVAHGRTSMIHFMPVNPSHRPQLFIAVPPEVELEGGFRDMAVERQGTASFGGRELACYAVQAGAKASKWTFFWRLVKPLPAGAELTGCYWGEWKGGRQEAQPLRIQVVEIPETRPFRKIPVYLSMPNDFFTAWPDLAGLRQSGFNHVDLWTYLHGDERAWGEGLLRETLRHCQAAGVRPIGWIREWWWHEGRREPDGQATLLDGSRTQEMLCLSYRGRTYQELLAQGRHLIDQGVTFHCSDPEMYGKGSRICFCERCVAGFREWLAAEPGAPAFMDPREFERAPERHPALHRAWAAYKCQRYADFFGDYRKAMEAYMKKKGVPGPFVFMIYCSYHRSFPGFAAYADYRDSHSYLETLEDPARLAKVFDILAPMIYMDVYANYKDYDMLLPATDTAVLRRITRDAVPVAPILCAGYPFVYAFGSDLNAEMLKYNMLEVIAAGGRGFGFWGECPFDAADARAVAEVVAMLAPYEELILRARPVADGATVPAGNALARRLQAPDGSLVLVAEYSRRPLEVVVRCPVAKAARVIDLRDGKCIAALAPGQPEFRVRLDQDRAVMLYVGE